MNNSWDFHSRSLGDTERLSQLVAAQLHRGIVIALIGDLGAGKTHLTKSLCSGMGVSSDDVSSPTFVLIHQYAGRLPVFHFDTYRLADIDEFLDLGVEEMFESDAVSVVEWADRVAEILPADHLEIRISVDGECDRTFRISGTGPLSNSLVKAIAAEALTDW